ncbi:uncharacterized protein [Ptychodera flava]|uniref:uncharacterized protein n=1 Tax=Ptychodera flava TaxID=63121 RepID=UPI00396A21EB
MSLKPDQQVPLDEYEGNTSQTSASEQESCLYSDHNGCLSPGQQSGDTKCSDAMPTQQCQTLTTNFGIEMSAILKSGTTSERICRSQKVDPDDSKTDTGDFNAEDNNSVHSVLAGVKDTETQADKEMQTLTERTIIRDKEEAIVKTEKLGENVQENGKIGVNLHEDEKNYGSNVTCWPPLGVKDDSLFEKIHHDPKERVGTLPSLQEMAAVVCMQNDVLLIDEVKSDSKDYNKLQETNTEFQSTDGLQLKSCLKKLEGDGIVPDKRSVFDNSPHIHFGSPLAETIQYEVSQSTLDDTEEILSQDFNDFMEHSIYENDEYKTYSYNIDGIRVRQQEIEIKDGEVAPVPNLFEEDDHGYLLSDSDDCKSMNGNLTSYLSNVMITSAMKLLSERESAMYRGCFRNVIDGSNTRDVSEKKEHSIEQTEGDRDVMSVVEAVMDTLLADVVKNVSKQQFPTTEMPIECCRNQPEDEKVCTEGTVVNGTTEKRVVVEQIPSVVYSPNDDRENNFSMEELFFRMAGAKLFPQKTVNSNEDIDKVSQSKTDMVILDENGSEMKACKDDQEDQPSPEKSDSVNTEALCCIKKMDDITPGKLVEPDNVIATITEIFSPPKTDINVGEISPVLLNDIKEDENTSFEMYNDRDISEEAMHRVCKLSPLNINTTDVHKDLDTIDGEEGLTEKNITEVSHSDQDGTKENDYSVVDFLGHHDFVDYKLSLQAEILYATEEIVLSLFQESLNHNENTKPEENEMSTSCGSENHSNQFSSSQDGCKVDANCQHGINEDNFIHQEKSESTDMRHDNIDICKSHETFSNDQAEMLDALHLEISCSSVINQGVGSSELKDTTMEETIDNHRQSYDNNAGKDEHYKSILYQLEDKEADLPVEKYADAERPACVPDSILTDFEILCEDGEVHQDRCNHPQTRKRKACESNQGVRNDIGMLSPTPIKERSTVPCDDHDGVFEKKHKFDTTERLQQQRYPTQDFDDEEHIMSKGMGKTVESIRLSESTIVSRNENVQDQISQTDFHCKIPSVTQQEVHLTDTTNSDQEVPEEETDSELGIGDGESLYQGSCLVDKVIGDSDRGEAVTTCSDSDCSSSVPELVESQQERTGIDGSNLPKTYSSNVFPWRTGQCSLWQNSIFPSTQSSHTYYTNPDPNDAIQRVRPLPNLGAQRRVGLSRKQRVKSLHPYINKTS